MGIVSHLAGVPRGEKTQHIIAQRMSLLWIRRWSKDAGFPILFNEGSLLLQQCVPKSWVNFWGNTARHHIALTNHISW